MMECILPVFLPIFMQTRIGLHPKPDPNSSLWLVVSGHPLVFSRIAATLASSITLVDDDLQKGCFPAGASTVSLVRGV